LDLKGEGAVNLERNSLLNERSNTIMISAAFRYEKKRVNVLGREMAYVEVGSGDPIVFLHGNPSSSYLWRNVIPHLQELGRCLAPDLIGMGDSEKLPHSGPGSYTFVEHSRYLDALLEGLGVNERVTLVIHDWGGALGFHWANRHRDAVKGIAYMEAPVRPRLWAEWDEQVRALFQALRSPAGEKMVLEQNFFVESMLPRTVIRPLTDEEMEQYRRPFAEPGEGRRPTLTIPRQIPLDGEPPDVAEIATAYSEWLSQSTVPKLFVNGDPGGALIGASREFCRSWPEQTEVTVRGLHFLQEDSPDELGQAVATWFKTLK
jgi:haloalkane dehalogenase